MLFVGNCHSYRTEAECLDTREGIRCVWVDDTECMPPTLADQKKMFKNVEKVSEPTCEIKPDGKVLIHVMELSV